MTIKLLKQNNWKADVIDNWDWEEKDWVDFRKKKIGSSFSAC